MACKGNLPQGVGEKVLAPYPKKPVIPVIPVIGKEKVPISGQNPITTTGDGPVMEPVIEATKDLGEPTTDEVARILAVWRDLGIKDLEAQRAKEGLKPVGEHLADLRAHEAQWRVEDAKIKKGET